MTAKTMKSQPPKSSQIASPISSQAPHKRAPATPPKSSSQKSRLLSSQIAYKGKVFSVFKDKVEEPGGHLNTREVIRHNGSVVILAVDASSNPGDPDIVLERQYRHAAGQVLIELPAGRLDAGETPLAGAKRELIEETGYRARRWTLLTRYFASPGFLGEWMQIYLAENLRAGEAAPEEDENIDVFRMPLSQAIALAEANKIHDGKTLIGLMLYDLGRRAGRFR